MSDFTPITAPPTYETLKASWLGRAPTTGASERYDRERNFELWARAHNIFPEGTVEHRPTAYVQCDVFPDDDDTTYTPRDVANWAWSIIELWRANGYRPVIEVVMEDGSHHTVDLEERA